MICPECSNKVENDNKICRHCGYVLLSNEADINKNYEFSKKNNETATFLVEKTVSSFKKMHIASVIFTMFAILIFLLTAYLCVKWLLISSNFKLEDVLKMQVRYDILKIMVAVFLAFMFVILLIELIGESYITYSLSHNVFIYNFDYINYLKSLRIGEEGEIIVRVGDIKSNLIFIKVLLCLIKPSLNRKRIVYYIISSLVVVLSLILIYNGLILILEEIYTYNLSAFVLIQSLQNVPPMEIEIFNGQLIAGGIIYLTYYFFKGAFDIKTLSLKKFLKQYKANNK